MWPRAPGWRAQAMPTGWPAFRQAAEVVQSVKVTLDRGVEIFDFEELTENPVEAYTWVRQAVRFARREAGE